MKPAVDTAVADMPGPAALPRRNGELVFEAPWEGRAFGLALAVVRQLGLDWSEFQRHLIAEIAKHPEAPYYECWVTALEALVLDRRVVATGELEATRQAIERASG